MSMAEIFWQNLTSVQTARITWNILGKIWLDKIVMLKYVSWTTKTALVI
jgi:hypothetical protein